MKSVDISPELRAVLSRLEKGTDERLMTAIGAYYARDKKARISRGGITPKPAPLTIMNRPGSGNALADTGALVRSIDYTSGSDTVIIGSPLMYARIVSEGGRVAAKRAQKLAIPFGRRVAAAVRAAGSVRAYLKGREVRFTRGAIIVDGEVEFIRKKSVDIPPRPFLKETPANIAHIGVIYDRWVQS